MEIGIAKYTRKTSLVSRGFSIYFARKFCSTSMRGFPLLIDVYPLKQHYKNLDENNLFSRQR